MIKYFCRRTFFAIILFVGFTFNSVGDSAVDKESKRKNIRKLMELSGAGDLGKQVMNSMINVYKAQMPDVPTEFWIEWVKETKSDSLTDLVIPIYEKYLTDDEIKVLIKFYTSPTGKKLTEVTPLIMKDSMAAGQAWGMELGKDIVSRLKDKGLK